MDEQQSAFGINSGDGFLRKLIRERAELLEVFAAEFATAGWPKDAAAAAERRKKCEELQAQIAHLDWLMEVERTVHQVRFLVRQLSLGREKQRQTIVRIMGGKSTEPAASR